VRARRGLAAVLLAGAAAVAGLGPVLWVTAQPALAFAQTVEMKDGNNPPTTYGYSPSVAPIKPNDKIIFLNNSHGKHTVTSDTGSLQFDFTLPPGREEEIRFPDAGTYTYHCKLHDWMKGRIEVSDSPPTSATTAPPTTTTTGPPPTTATAPAPTTTAPPTTTTTEPRPAAGAPPATVAPAPAPTTATTAPATTTSVPSTTTTTTAPPTTPTSAPPVLAGGEEGSASSSSAPSTSAPSTTATTPSAAPGDQNSTAAGPVSTDGKLDVGAVILVAALVAVGAFGAWTLIRVRPGRI